LPRSPYYSSRPGTARLTNDRFIKGKFYYHIAPLSSAVSFYFYPKGTSSQQIIPVNQLKTLTITNQADTARHYTIHQRNGKLFIKNSKGIQQELTRKLFVTL
jgi:hypothetical protein